MREKVRIELIKALNSSWSGGKAANLARAIQYGFTVPDGCVLPTNTLSLFLDFHELRPRIQELLQEYDSLQRNQLHHATQIAREFAMPFINLADVDFVQLPDQGTIEIDGQAGTLVVIEEL